MASENSPDAKSVGGDLLRRFGEEKFGTMKSFAAALGMSPPALHGYLTGYRVPGRTVLAKLASLGFDVGLFVGYANAESKTQVGKRTEGARGEANAEDLPPLALGAAFTLLPLPVEAIADQVEATPKQVQSWIDKAASPSHRQLALLFNLVAIAGVAARCGGHAAAVSHPASSDTQGVKAA